MTPEQRRPQWDELCFKIQSLIVEYGECIPSPDLLEHLEQVHGAEGVQPPDWSSPYNINHWVLLFSLEDLNPLPDSRGFYLFGIHPWDQRPYITQGLVNYWQESE